MSTGQEHDAKVGVAILHIVHDIVEGLLLQPDINAVSVVALFDFGPQAGDGIAEKIGAHGGNTEIFLPEAALFIKVLHKVHLVQNLPGVAEKFPAGLRDGDTLFRAVKDFDAELVLQSLDAVADVVRDV